MFIAKIKPKVKVTGDYYERIVKSRFLSLLKALLKNYLFNKG